MVSFRWLSLPLAVLASLVVASGAGADQRYAAPGGGFGPACPQLTPCNIEVAIEGAGNGDEVIVEPGVLAAGANEIDATATNLLIHGPATGPKPEITSSALTALRADGSNTVIRNLKLTHTAPGGMTSGLLLDGTTAEQMEVNSSSTFGCGLAGGATIRDSICVSTGTNAGALAVIGFLPSIGYARNVTAIATGSGSYGALVYAAVAGVTELDARNVIAQGLPDVGTITNTGTSTAKATMSFSDYVTSQATGTGTSVITPAGTATNILAIPLFVNPVLGDYHQAAGSPTIDAGATDARTGTLDIDGGARVQGTSIDIGADELTPPPPPPADSTPPETTISSGPAKKTKSKKAKFIFSADEAATFTCKLDRGDFKPCTSPTKYKKLKKGKHKFSVTATDAATNIDSTSATYKWTVKKKSKKKHG